MTMITEACAGARFAAELGLTVAGAEGHDLLCACVNCESSDAMHVHQDTGVVFCFSCKHTQSPLQLAESLLRDRTRAWELLDRCGLGTKGAVSINGHAAASAPAKAKKKNRPPGFKTMVGAISNRRSWLISETPGLTIDSRGMSWEYHQADGSVRSTARFGAAVTHPAKSLFCSTCPQCSTPIPSGLPKARRPRKR